VDFEAENAGYTSHNIASDPADAYDYFVRTNDPNKPYDATKPGMTTSYSNTHGYFIAADDNDEYGDAEYLEGTITTNSVSIAGYGSVEVQVDIAGDAAFADYESAERVYLEYSINGGGWNRLVGYCGNSASASTPLYEDRDLDGIGDGQRITPVFTTFKYAIPATGSTIQVQFRVALGPAEDFAFDNIKIIGNP
jgi:hypothetical protein